MSKFSVQNFVEPRVIKLLDVRVLAGLLPFAAIPLVSSHILTHWDLTAFHLYRNLEPATVSPGPALTTRLPSTSLLSPMTVISPTFLYLLPPR